MQIPSSSSAIVCLALKFSLQALAPFWCCWFVWCWWEVQALLLWEAIFLPWQGREFSSSQELPSQSAGGFITHHLLRDSGGSVGYSEVL